MRSRDSSRAATARLCSSSAGSGSVEERRQLAGRAASNQRKPNASTQLAADGVRADGDRPPVQRRLDRRVAEPLPRRREGDGVARRVEVGDRRRPAVDLRSTRHRAAASTARARRRSRPRRGPSASTWRRAPRPAARRRARPCGGWRAPGAARAARRRRRRRRPASRLDHRRAGRGRSRCRSSWRGCHARASSSCSVSRLMVTWRQAGSSTGSSVTAAHCGRCHGGSWWCRIAGRSAQHAGHDPGGREVHGDGQEVLDDDEVDVVEGGGHLAVGPAARRRRGRGRRRRGRRRPRRRRSRPRTRTTAARPPTCAPRRPRRRCRPGGTTAGRRRGTAR